MFEWIKDFFNTKKILEIYKENIFEVDVTNQSVTNTLQKEVISEIKIFEEITNPSSQKKIDKQLEFPFNDGLFDSKDFEKNYSNFHTNGTSFVDTYEHPGIRHRYRTNISELTCSCLDWKNTRIKYALDDPRRLCKHLINKITDIQVDAQFPFFRESILFYKEKERGFKRDIKELKDLSEFGLKIMIDNDWCDVFDSNGKRYGYKYDFEALKHTWAKGSKPLNSHKIQELFESVAIKPIPLSCTELETLAVWLENNRNYKGCQFSIRGECMYMLSPGVLAYTVYEEYKNQFLDEVEFISVSPEYIHITFEDGNPAYLKRLNVSDDNSDCMEWKNFEYVIQETEEVRVPDFGWAEKMYQSAPSKLKIDGYSLEDSLLGKYENMTKRKFHVAVKKLGIMENPYGANWIFTEQGLAYGYNVAVKRTYALLAKNFISYEYDNENKIFNRIVDYEASYDGKSLYPFSVALFKIDLFDDLVQCVLGYDISLQK